jgi:RNA polymerase primary sigma factor
VQDCVDANAQPKSLTRSTGGEGPSLEETLEDRNGEGSDRSIATQMLRKNTAKVLDLLDERKAEILRLSFGIGCETTYTLTEIAEKLDLSRERVRQIKAASIGLLRHPVKRKLLGIL